MSERVVTISNELWKTAKENPAFTELLEDIEDAEDLNKAKTSAKSFFNFDKYVKERRRKKLVSNSRRK